MRLPEDYDEPSNLGTPVMGAIIAVIVFLALIFIVVMVVNRQGDGGDAKTSIETEQTQAQIGTSSGYPDTEQLISNSTLTPDDLDFWDKYPESTEDTEQSEETTKDDTDEEDIYSDGYHTLVTYRDGTQEWIAINSDIAVNTYEPTNMIRSGNIMKYFVNDKEVSYVGVNLSENQTEVDYEALKDAGVDYCMIRVGVRGYSTGQLVEDKQFKTHMDGAIAAGLDVGVYFVSQAISTQEAQIEAAKVIEMLKDYSLDYPVAYDMGYVINDTGRTDDLTKSQRTKIAEAFLRDIRTAGYKTLLCADKTWLLTELNLLRLSGHEVWLDEPGDIPDYPYKYTMWKYSDSVSIDGISGYAEMSISFIDYSEK
ncbi:MAG: hypothetical protein IJ327_00470 [Lachnospiraceae bacterium]|nr:hypothetical protein [Lachnospiraceae bacterium]